jgi:hypothetical protein
VPPVPGPADIRLALVAVHFETLLAQVLDGGQAGAAGTDHADRVATVIDRLVVLPDLGFGGPVRVAAPPRQ